jgi:2-polyprenyl-6-methoxyphenol hydroxylase-like FAD-dependent oxidoreductase
MDLGETTQTVSAEDVNACIEKRLGARFRPTDIAWFSPFRMHRRMASRLTDGRRFLIGDAAHLSSPFGGEGLNAGLHDAYDLAWKLALVLHGRGRRSLVAGYEIERAIADRHALDISDQVHKGIVGIADIVRQGREVPSAVVDPYADALLRNARAMSMLTTPAARLSAIIKKSGLPTSGRILVNAIPTGCGSTERLIICCFSD